MLSSLTYRGRARLVRSCRLPVTGLSVVRRIYTPAGTLLPAGDGFAVAKTAPGWTLDDIASRVDAPVAVLESH
jgi:acyl CoA:acetate/3-ketoacid CoA transferase beta subunit